MVHKQAPSAILMVQPLHFGYNEETAQSNAFQQIEGKENTKVIQEEANQEFDNFIAQLQANLVQVIVFDPDDDLATTDEVFPNNWVSFHEDGKVIIYPMMAPSRRLERRMEFITALDKQHGFEVSDIIDLSHYERKGLFLEGTGSLVLDYINKIAYANTSARTHPDLLSEIVAILGYKNCQFIAVDQSGLDIYHTNVLMCIAEKFAVICLESIPDDDQRKNLERQLIDGGHEIVAISYSQLERFAGNMMQVTNQRGESITIMSKNAFLCLDQQQKSIIERHSKILAIPIPTIEKYGGGSVRCMMSGIFLPRT